MRPVLYTMSLLLFAAVAADFAAYVNFRDHKLIIN